jgi:hypothetical protein
MESRYSDPGSNLVHRIRNHVLVSTEHSAFRVVIVVTFCLHSVAWINMFTASSVAGLNPELNILHFLRISTVAFW